jgi:predicted ATPase/DNA-binding CsgD family transcriptional regulator
MHGDPIREARVPHNLPARLSSFVGRERETADAVARLRSHRLLTLGGAPGVGKTRLSLVVAEQALASFPDGVWLVELAPLADPSLVPQAVANVLGVKEQPGRPLTTTLAEYLRRRHLLLLLDNCEHLILAAATLADELLRACPLLHLLATSREPLAIDGEVIYRVPSLSLPDAPPGQDAEALTLDAVARSEAAQLFVQRSQAASASFSLAEQNASTVAQIVARLDGIPLALELTAARVRALSLEEIAARLDDRFQLLTGGSRTALPRQQTLRGAVDWSYALLSVPEQRLLRHLAVFAGGFTLDAADLLGGEPGADDSGDTDTAGLLVLLVDKSLVQVDEGADGEQRYRLLETLRQYGLEKLSAHGELEAARHRHRDYFLTFAGELRRVKEGEGRPDRLATIELEYDNLRSALIWSLDNAVTHSPTSDDPAAAEHASNAAAAASLALTMQPIWWRSGWFSEGDMLSQCVLDLPDARQRIAPDMYARVLVFAANLADHLGDTARAITLATEALAIWRGLDDEDGMIYVLQRLAFFHGLPGSYEVATSFAQEALTRSRRLGDPTGLNRVLFVAGNLAWRMGHFERAVELAEECLALRRQVDRVEIQAYALRLIARARAGLGQFERAASLVEESLRYSQQAREQRGIAEAFKESGYVAWFSGDTDRAIEMFRESLQRYQRIGDRWGVILSIHGLAGAWTLRASDDSLASAHGSSDLATERFAEALRLFGAADGLRDREQLTVPLAHRPQLDRDLALLQSHLGTARFEAAWNEGRRMTLEQAVEYALAITAPDPPFPDSQRIAGEPPTSHAAADADPLTRREREIAVLVAHGHTNRQIAEQLGLSERTVDAHLRNIMGKLDAASRSQVAAWIAANGLLESRST